MNNHCRFCLANDLLVDTQLYANPSFFILGSIEAHRPYQAIIVPHRHFETPFDMNATEWSDIGDALSFTKSLLASSKPAGFTIGWNVGAAAGQDVFHAHLHVIARFEGGEEAGRGIHAIFRDA